MFRLKSAFFQEMYSQRKSLSALRIFRVFLNLHMLRKLTQQNTSRTVSENHNKKRNSIFCRCTYKTKIKHICNTVLESCQNKDRNAKKDCDRA